MFAGELSFTTPKPHCWDHFNPSSYYTFHITNRFFRAQRSVTCWLDFWPQSETKTAFILLPANASRASLRKKVEPNWLHPGAVLENGATLEGGAVGGGLFKVCTGFVVSFWIFGSIFFLSDSKFKLYLSHPGNVVILTVIEWQCFDEP